MNLMRTTLSHEVGFRVKSLSQTETIPVFVSKRNKWIRLYCAKFGIVAMSWPDEPMEPEVDVYCDAEPVADKWLCVRANAAYVYPPLKYLSEDLYKSGSEAVVSHLVHYIRCTLRKEPQLRFAPPNILVMNMLLDKPCPMWGTMRPPPLRIQNRIGDPVEPYGSVKFEMYDFRHSKGTLVEAASGSGKSFFISENPALGWVDGDKVIDDCLGHDIWSELGTPGEARARMSMAQCLVNYLNETNGVILFNGSGIVADYYVQIPEAAHILN